MILFALEKYEALGAELERSVPGLRTGEFRVARYDSGELHATVHTPVAFEHCVVLGSIAPPDEQLLSVLLLAHTLRKEGAGKLTGLLPYLGYSRQDRDKPGESLAAHWAGQLLEAAGFDRVVTVDVHSEADRQLFLIPIISLDTAQLFAETLKRYRLADATIVAPDNGAIARARALQIAAGLPEGEIPYFEKQRIGSGIAHVGPIGKVGPRAVIIDDMLDTGLTLVSACQKLRETGVGEIYILVTHGLFTGERWKQLWSLGVKRIVCTDTVPVSLGPDRIDIETLSIAPLLRAQLLLLEGRGPATASELDSAKELTR